MIHLRIALLQILLKWKVLINSKIIQQIKKEVVNKFLVKPLLIIISHGIRNLIKIKKILYHLNRIHKL